MRICFSISVGFYFLFNTVTVTFAQTADIPPGTKITTCGDGAGWPPYTFFELHNNEQTDNIVGYDVDVLNAILPKHNLNVIVEMPPWKRCLHETDKGEKYQIALSSSYNEERDKTYLMTRYYYTVTPHYFYLKKQLN